MQLRRAEASDLPALIELEQSVAEAPHWSPAVWEQALRSDLRAVFVAEAAGALIGFVVMAVVAAVAEVESIAVAAQARRCGVGRALLRSSIKWASEQAAEVVELEVRASSQAIPLYLAVGFTGQGRRRAYYANPEEDAVLMMLELRGVSG
jgi:ribosomal-protein-alanine N-acetyltransferase